MVVAMSKWTRGTRAPVTSELDVTDMIVDGTIPDLSGRLVRLGPNPIGPVPDDHHWFAGSGMAHAIDLDRGHPTRYQNRWVRTPEVSERLGEPAAVGHSEHHELANTTAMVVAGELLAMTETCPPFALGRDLETIRRVDFGAGVEHFTAHPHVDPVTGDTFGVGYQLNEEPSCMLHRIGPDGRQRSAHTIELLSSRSVHDFAFTERWIVIWDLPLDVTASPSGSFAARWNNDGGARVGVIDRASLAGDAVDAAPTWFEIDPCWVFHPVNAYDTPTGVVIDVCQFDKVFAHDVTGPGDPYPPQLWRWELDLGGTAVTRTLIDERVQEFPRIDQRRWSSRHRYGYTTELMSGNGAPSILAHDLEAGTADSWTSEVGHSLSEAIFVPDTHDSDENEGWLLAVDSTAEWSDLVVLDATSVSDGPVGRVRLPQRIPDGFHGDWIPA